MQVFTRAPPKVEQNKKPQREIPAQVGIKNLGNTCFLNVVLQSFGSIQSFQLHLLKLAALKKAIKTDSKSHKLPLTEALKQTLSDLCTGSAGRVIEPRAVTELPDLRKRFFSGREQQDAHELMQFVMSMLSEESDRVASFNRVSDLSCIFSSSKTDNDLSSLFFSPLLSDLDIEVPPMEIEPAIIRHKKNMFMGLLKSTLKCTRCHHVPPANHSDFVDLSLAIPKARGGSCTLEECLKFFTDPEIIEDVICDNCTRKSQETQTKHVPFPSLKGPLGNVIAPPAVTTAPKVNVKTKALKRLSIARAPEVLCLHIRRLVTTSFGVRKLEIPIEYPMELDLVPYCTFAGEIAPPTSTNPVPQKEPVSFNAVDSFLSGRGRKSSSVSIPGANNITNNNLSTSPSLSTSPEAIVGGSNSFSRSALETKRKIPTSNNSSNLSEKVKEPLGNNSLRYRLVSVIMHLGNHASGHYTVFRRLVHNSAILFGSEEESLQNPSDSSKDQWVYISDHEVRRVDEESVLAAQGNAYMLYYEKMAVPE